MGAIRYTVQRRKAKVAAPCLSCTGMGKRPCQCCKGKLVLDYQPFESPQTKRWCVCPACSAKGLQKCLNCLGSGRVVPA
ncbi:hypothetical protein WJX72_009750 [[Myrmecia] bisecta]|uniref:Uncharacterized protein n=1 Tax=[Myrmecia] bisecta TaxID=41462 RepID=A0AAW1Q658_9CHLO